jgi:hypothetical protein
MDEIVELIEEMIKRTGLRPSAVLVSREFHRRLWELPVNPSVGYVHPAGINTLTISGFPVEIDVDMDDDYRIDFRMPAGGSHEG